MDTKSKGKKILIFGNGGSAAIASHFSVDLTKNALDAQIIMSMIFCLVLPTIMVMKNG